MTDFLPEVVGHEEARERLGRLLARDRVPHGILLVGEDGRGKRTLALAFARVLLAGDPEGRVDPASPAARKVDAGTHGDLFVVEPEADQRLLGIERIRTLKESFSLTIVEGTRRVAVVARADRLTPEAGNALLKLLEEPPPGSHLILTGRAREAVMETLVSRCLVLPVPPVPTAAVEDLLRARGIDEDRVTLLAAVAEGCPGVALALAAEGEEGVIAPAAALLLSPGAPLERGEAVTDLLREGASNLEAARIRMRAVLGLVGHALRRALQRASGASDPGGWDPPGEALAALDARTPEDLEDLLRLTLRTAADLDRNVSLDVILDAFATRVG